MLVVKQQSKQRTTILISVLVVLMVLTIGVLFWDSFIELFVGPSVSVSQIDAGGVPTSSIDTSFFDSEGFQSLNEAVTDLEIGPKGRSNPFTHVSQ